MSDTQAHSLEVLSRASERSSAAIILAGTHGWGGDALEAACPSLMLPIANAPLYVTIYAALQRAGIGAAVVCTNSTPAAISRQIGDGLAAGVDTYYYVDRVPRGPAGCSRDAATLVSADRYVIIEGSVVPGVDLARVLRAHERHRPALTIVVQRGAKGGGDGWLSPAGIYIAERDAFEGVPPVSYHDIKENLLPRLYRQGKAIRVYHARRAAARVRGLERYIGAQAEALAAIQESGVEPLGYTRRGEALIHRTAWVSRSARLVGAVMIGPQSRVRDECALLGPVVIGCGCEIEAGCVIGRSVLWDGCTIGSGALIEGCVVRAGAAAPRHAEVRHAVCAVRRDETA